ncbi:uncharacterized protein LOC120000623 [Tripterygium wilfordii]|uniref:uncharacterized protein LOC120000623 n=1 Tax=Tripterygium wilfordii TaxID=458696 RepID=UPI0018F84AC9|nr:uncharacterized protein LOC120000623 [Tripterygium wilfordii]
MENNESKKEIRSTYELQQYGNTILDIENNGHGIKQDASTKEIISSGELFMVDYTSEFITYDIYKSKEDLISWARAAATRTGHVLTIRASDVGGTVISNETKSVKKRMCIGTKKYGCPFLLRGKTTANGDGWILEVINGTHNHPSAVYYEGHSYAGRLTCEQTELLVDMSKNMVMPKEILCTIKQKDPLNATTLRTIYNARHKHKVIEKAGRTQMASTDGTDTVADLIWAHPKSIDLLRTFSRVLLLDCTYKTNRYRMPLLEVVGVTSTNLTFSVAFAYLGRERVENYLWILLRLRSFMEDYGCDLP